MRVIIQVVAQNRLFQSLFWRGAAVAFAPSSPCPCCRSDQFDTIDHMIASCPVYEHQRRQAGLTVHRPLVDILSAVEGASPVLSQIILVKVRVGAVTHSVQRGRPNPIPDPSSTPAPSFPLDPTQYSLLSYYVLKFYYYYYYRFKFIYCNSLNSVNFCHLVLYTTGVVPICVNKNVFIFYKIKRKTSCWSVVKIYNITSADKGL